MCNIEKFILFFFILHNLWAPKKEMLANKQQVDMAKQRECSEEIEKMNEIEFVDYKF